MQDANIFYYQKDYVRFCMTGEYATEVSDASGMQLLDIPKRQWSDEILEKLDIDKNLLAKVYESPEVTGHINDEFAKLSGLSTDTVVVGGAGDNAAAAIGTGIVKDGKSIHYNWYKRCSILHIQIN